MVNKEVEMKKHNYMSISQCVCPECNQKFPIPRIKGRDRAKGHQKTIWCPFCKTSRTMTEIRDMDFVPMIAEG